MAQINQVEQFIHDLSMSYTKRIREYKVGDITNDISDKHMRGIFEYISGITGINSPTTKCEFLSYTAENLGAGYYVPNKDGHSILILFTVESVHTGTELITICQCYEVTDSDTMLRGADITRNVWEPTTTNAFKHTALVQNIIDFRLNIFDKVAAIILTEKDR